MTFKQNKQVIFFMAVLLTRKSELISLFLSSCRDTHESLGELETAMFALI